MAEIMSIEAQAVAVRAELARPYWRLSAETSSAAKISRALIPEVLEIIENDPGPHSHDIDAEIADAVYRHVLGNDVRRQ